MPNGRPGDHPLTDVLHHGLSVFGDEADGLIREIAALGGTAELRGDPWIWGRRPLADDHIARLRRLRDRLRDQRGARGAGDDASS